MSVIAFNASIVKPDKNKHHRAFTIDYTLSFDNTSHLTMRHDMKPRKTYCH